MFENDATLTPPLSHNLVEAVVTDHLPRFSRVLLEAWSAYAATREKAPSEMASASTSSRGMLVSDFIHEPAHRIFGPVPDVWVDDRYKRPWVNLAGGAVQVRFRKLTRDLELCRNTSDRALRLAFHLGDPVLPGMEEFTVLTAGYVLDRSEQQIERLALVCHLGSSAVHYAIPLPMEAPSVSGSITRSSVDVRSLPVVRSIAVDVTHEHSDQVAQLPLTPLSPPLIRSARTAARARLVSGHDSTVAAVPLTAKRDANDE